ncbi:hypothetical protein JKP88DRAFT_275006 [Tribonema minus]|uniref:Uncharacterized protein n=1 Tax=Tribonema minus TaxID=303371 RepID=A0A836CPK3_9STRA|nr:hypothetical protein JKP88DRAFT_275006 [Tribonema minus]
MALANRSPAGKAVELPILLGPLVQTRSQRPCLLYFEVTLLQPKQTPPGAVFVFQNYYASHVTLRVQRGGASDAFDWETVLDRHPLMRDPHYEGDAQHWHVLPLPQRVVELANGNEGGGGEGDGGVRCVRVCLHQSSPLWERVELRHFKLAALPSTQESQASEGESQGVEQLSRAMADDWEVFKSAS